MIATRIAWPSVGTAALETFELKEDCPPDCVLLETDFTLISPGTERAGLLNMPNTWGGSPFPRYPGYSAAGRILAVGAGVTNLAVGDREGKPEIELSGSLNLATKAIY